MKQIAICQHSLPLFAAPLLLVNLFGQDVKTPPPVPADQRADVYSVYSTLLGRPSLSHPNTNGRFVIKAATELPAPAQEPAGCIAVPGPYRARFQEILEDFETRKTQRYRLDRALTIVKAYDLVDEAGAKEFIELREHMSSSPDSRFAGAVDLITLGNVYFDRHRTLAMVHMSAWCGNLCGFWRWRILERQGPDHWEDRPWVRCVTIS
jgi:hypothetical protein